MVLCETLIDHPFISRELRLLAFRCLRGSFREDLRLDRGYGLLSKGLVSLFQLRLKMSYLPLELLDYVAILHEELRFLPLE